MGMKDCFFFHLTSMTSLDLGILLRAESQRLRTGAAANFQIYFLT